MAISPEKITIRTATLDDAAGLLEIYAPYVEKTAISFEYEVPSIEEFRGRMSRIMQKHPFIVAEKDGELSGYAYTGPFVGRAAYDWAAESTIYLKENKRKTGLGRRLYGVLEAVSGAQNILNLNACIGIPEREDEHLTCNSLRFHEHMGYRLVGEFRKCGYKFGAWYSMVWMEKWIGEHLVAPAPVVPFPELDRELLRTLGLRK